ncbi:hypothetical protein [Aquiflexum sp.]|uniref:hypothetical protein n=1 Tax=Aquiflexum sp. TaxID=1872584 RepID=UPI003593C644
MKKTLITFAILILGTGSWAQSNTTDENAIKKIVQKEAEAAENADYKQWIECFAKSPDVAFGFSDLLPTYMLRSYDKLAKFGKDFFPADPVPASGVNEFTDYQIRINGTSAFVTSVQINTNPDGIIQRFHKADYLEKIDGEWKMIGHFFSVEPKSLSDQGK